MSSVSNAMRRLLSRFRLPSGFVRAHERRSCAIFGELYFVDRGFGTRGVIDEISCGGMRFRPAQSFILERHGDAVSVRFDGYVLDGLLVNVSPKGYGLKLRAVLSEDEVDAIARQDDLFLDHAA